MVAKRGGGSSRRPRLGGLVGDDHVEEVANPREDVAVAGQNSAGRS
jgi:hypothetical protein